MAKDLIIGAASNYKYEDVQYWINSITESGFKGDVVLVVTNVVNDELEKIAKKGVQILAYGKKDEKGNYVSNSGLPPHVDRFFHIWNFLNSTEIEYRYVVTTDVRDVVFQSNPFDWIAENIGDKELIAAGEGLKYQDETWNTTNYNQTFGPFFFNKMKDNQIFNVGVIAGTRSTVKDVLLLLMQLSLNRPIPIVDQAVYNFILNIEMIRNKTLFIGNDEGWTINLGTTLGAILSGSGDIGQYNDPTSVIMYQTKYLCDQPDINGDVVSVNNKPYVIVHQYDRVRELVNEVRKKYS